jgi:hypothetical protein
VKISYRAVGVERLVSGFALPLRPLISKMVADVGAIALDFTKVYVPKKSYALHDSLGLKVILGALEADVFEGEFYGEIVRVGSPPHTIFPKAKKALFWIGADHPVNVVQSPGFRGFDYAEMAAESTVASMGPTLAQAAGDITDQALGK